jgi:hypothetical protein
VGCLSEKPDRKAFSLSLEVTIHNLGLANKIDAINSFLMASLLLFFMMMYWLLDPKVN